MKELIVVCLCLVYVIASSPIAIPQWTYEECYDGPKGRVPWILAKRQPDFGWKEHTHRANIALSVNRYRGEEYEMQQMKQQLQVEVTNALMRNNQLPIHDNDLALFIHALISSGINPRDFHGIDLVADLQQRVNAVAEPHPFLVLALCNSHAVEFEDLQKLRRMATIHQDTETRRELELKALSLKAFACAASLQNRALNKFNDDMKVAAQCLAAKQLSDGSFGNVYTTSLIVQALIAYDKSKPSWNQTAAFEFLLKESQFAMNMIRAYYIEMALNSRSVKFIKDLYPGTMAPGPEEPDTSFYIQYTVKGALRPDTYFTVTTKVRPNTSFFSIMQDLASQSNQFQFSYYINEEGDPMVYKMIDMPNNAEEGMFWRICLQRNSTKNFYSDTFTFSPAKLSPAEDQHIIMWYRDTECPSYDRPSI